MQYQVRKIRNLVLGSGAAGLAVAVVLALKNKSLIVVAACGCAAVFLMEQLIQFL